MSYSMTQLQQSAGRLSGWLGVWRILYLLFGGIALLSLLAALLYGLTGEISEGTSARELTWLLSLPALLVALSLWAYWSLLSWGKEWVDRSAQLALHGGDAGRLQELDRTLGKWITAIVWANIAFYLLGALGVWAAGQFVSGGFPAEALVAFAVILAVLLGTLLVGIYFPYTALRRFLAAATGRLSGQGQLLKVDADRLNTWCTVLIVLQVLYLLLTLLGGVTDADSGGLLGNLFALLLLTGITLLYILPLLAAGHYARTLAATLDQQINGGPGAAALPNYSQMGRLADEGMAGGPLDPR